MDAVQNSCVLTAYTRSVASIAEGTEAQKERVAYSGRQPVSCWVAVGELDAEWSQEVGWAGVSPPRASLPLAPQLDGCTFWAG